jgi:hypothetical protein
LTEEPSVDATLDRLDAVIARLNRLADAAKE